MLDHLKMLLPSDMLVIFYLSATGLLLILFNQHLPRWWVHCLFRMVCVFTVFLVASTSLLPTVHSWYPLLTILIFYAEVGMINQLFAKHYFDETIMAWEFQLFRAQPSVHFNQWLNNIFISELLHGFYLSYYGLILWLPIYLSLHGEMHLMQQVVFAEILTFYLCLSIYLFIPVAGPRYVFEKIATQLNQGVFFKLTHRCLEQGSSKGTAFPSSHVAMSVIVTLCAFQLNWKLGFISLLFAAGISLATVYGRFHYVLDVFGGVVAAIIPFIISQFIFNH